MLLSWLNKSSADNNNINKNKMKSTHSIASNSILMFFSFIFIFVIITTFLEMLYCMDETKGRVGERGGEGGWTFWKHYSRAGFFICFSFLLSLIFVLIRGFPLNLSLSLEICCHELENETKKQKSSSHSTIQRTKKLNPNLKSLALSLFI